MRANIKTNIKRGIAVGLIAIMAAVGPMETLQPTGAGAGAPAVAKAAETDKAPYIGEVRLAVDKDADKAKQILESEGYEVIDQDLNEKAGSWWNKQGDQAVYMGIKRTDDESKAIRDMKTMNMLGRYSDTDLKNAIKNNYSKSKELYSGLIKSVDLYRDNYEKGDYLAVKTHDLLNYIIEDDSGKRVGDLLLDDPDEESLIKMFVEGNKYLVSAISRALILSSEQKSSTGDVWTERMSAVPSYKDILKIYAKNLYGKSDVVGEEKERTGNFISSDLDKAAREILDRWDEIRSIFLSEEDMKNRLETAEEDGLEDEEIAELGEDIQNLSIVDYTKCVKYGKKSLYNFFILPKSAFVKDITRLYPFVYALSDAQKKMLPYMDYPILLQTAVTRIGLREQKKNVKERIESYLKKSSELASDVSLYEGVDRAMYSKNAASTSRATENMKRFNDDDKNINFTKKSMNALLYIAAGTFVVGAIGAGLCVYYYFEEFITHGTGEYIATINDFSDVIDKMALWHPVSYWLAIVGIGATVIFAGMAVYKWIQYQKLSHNYKQLPIPDVMVDFDIENDAGKYVVYHAARWNRDRHDNGDRADRADLNGDAAREWLALYTTTDKTMGDPILADSLVAKTGLAEGRIAPGENYVPLTMFGEEAIQNLVSENYSYNDEVDGIWVWYQKGNTTGETVVDDTEEAVSGDAVEEEDLADTTGSNISSGSAVLIGLGGGVVGIIAGIFIGFFIRRKKQSV